MCIISNPHPNTCTSEFIFLYFVIVTEKTGKGIKFKKSEKRRRRSPIPIYLSLSSSSSFCPWLRSPWLTPHLPKFLHIHAQEIHNLGYFLPPSLVNSGILYELNKSTLSRSCLIKNILIKVIIQSNFHSFVKALYQALTFIFMCWL